MTPIGRALLAYVALAFLAPLAGLAVYDTACVETTEYQP